MGYSISGTTISLTRGDTLRLTVGINNPDGTQYIPSTGDKIRFAMKQNYNDPVPLVIKDISIDTMELYLHPDDTKNLPFDTYVYDVQITKVNGDVDTFISKAKIKITEEVC